MQINALDGQTSFRSVVGHTILIELYDYWLKHRGDDHVMPKSKLDPVEIPQLLKNLILADVLDGGRSVRYRLVGTEIVRAHGVDYTGKTLEELTQGTTLSFSQTLYGLVVSNAAPVFSQGRFRWEGKEHCWTRRLHLPLAKDNDEIGFVLVGQVFEGSNLSKREELRPARPAELTADRISLESDSGQESS